jgi:ClpP class serine protease
MKFNIWGAEEAWLVDYLNNRVLAKIKPTEKDLTAYYELRTSDNRIPKILNMEGDTASIKIYGYLSPNGPDYYDYYYGGGGTGYNEIIASIEQIKNNTQIENINLLMDTPGGQMKGVDNVWQQLMSLRKKKKITAIAQGLLASCGYYLASAAHKIHSTSEMNEIGSIGVMVAGIDFSEMRKKEGIKKIVIVSKNAPDKDEDIGTKKGQKILQERVDTFERFFLERISAGRGLETDFIAENFGRGGLLVSKHPQEGRSDALSVKMIDKVLNISEKTGATSAPVKFNAKQEEPVSLTVYLAANPEMKAEFDQLIKTEYDKGVTAGHKAGQEKVEARIKKTFAFMGKDSVYPVRIQNLAFAVAKGEKSVEALEAVVEVHDMNEEEKKSAEAKKETNKTAETPGDPPDGSKPDGKVRDKESMDAAIKETKNLI